MWRRPGGLLAEQEQQRAVQVCMRLLQHLHTWAADWKPPEAAVQTAPRPASHAQAVLQLLARLTKRHGLALKASPLLVCRMSRATASSMPSRASWQQKGRRVD